MSVLEIFRNNKLLNVKKSDKFWFKRNKFKIIILFIIFDDDLRLLKTISDFSKISKSLKSCSDSTFPGFYDFISFFFWSLHFLRDMKSNVKCISNRKKVCICFKRKRLYAKEREKHIRKLSPVETICNARQCHSGGLML